jgi:hypothetical protein
MSNDIQMYRSDQELLQLGLRLERAEWCLQVATETLRDIAGWDSVDVWDLRKEAKRVLDWVENVTGNGRSGVT